MNAKLRTLAPCQHIKVNLSRRARQTKKKRERQRDRQIDRQTDRQTNRQTNKGSTFCQELENLRLRETVEARPRLELSRSLLSPASPSTSLSTSAGIKSEGSQTVQFWSLGSTREHSIKVPSCSQRSAEFGIHCATSPLYASSVTALRTLCRILC